MKMHGPLTFVGVLAISAPTYGALKVDLQGPSADACEIGTSEFEADGCQHLDQTSQPRLPEIEDFTGFDDLELFYKHDFGDDAPESGTFADSYYVDWILDEDGEPFDGDLNHIAGEPSILCPECVFEVKDGREGIWYFDLYDDLDPENNHFSAQWNGTDTIEFRNFFEQNAISHVSIFGNSERTEVPLPGTLALFAMGLVSAGVGFRYRRVRREV